MTHFSKYSLFIMIIFLSTGGPANSQNLPFGGPEDVAFSQKLWQILVGEKLVGPKAIGAHPNEGGPPHGDILVTLESNISVDGREAAVIVKRNYGGESVSVESVATNPRLGLKAVTVMFRREKGYDPKGTDWFWVKFRADGGLHKNPKGVNMAGRISPNESDGCKAFLRAAPGDDFVFLHDRFAK